MFNAFFKKADMASTYKPVFLAGLVDIAARKAGGPLDVDGWIRSDGDGRVRVDLELAAIPFAKFYWDMLAGFGPRHTPIGMADDKNRRKDLVNIVKVINEEIMRRKRGGLHAGEPGGGAPPTLKELASDGMAEFRKKVVKKSIKPEVVKHLSSNARKTRRGRGRQGASERQEPKFGLYEYRGAENCIVLDAGAVEYMGRNEFTLKAALGELIDRHLEKNNPTARHIATMVNLNKECKDKSIEVDKLACEAVPSPDEIDPLLSISLDLTAGLASLSRSKA